jgi:hypothetical protein
MHESMLHHKPRSMRTLVQNIATRAGDLVTELSEATARADCSSYKWPSGSCSGPWIGTTEKFNMAQEYGDWIRGAARLGVSRGTDRPTMLSAALFRGCDLQRRSEAHRNRYSHEQQPPPQTSVLAGADHLSSSSVRSVTLIRPVRLLSGPCCVSIHWSAA